MCMGEIYCNVANAPHVHLDKHMYVTVACVAESSGTVSNFFLKDPLSIWVRLDCLILN